MHSKNRDGREWISKETVLKDAITFARLSVIEPAEIAVHMSDPRVPGDDIARVVIKDRRQIHPSPANDLQIGEVSLPQLIDGCCFVSELLSSLDHDESRAGNQIKGFEQPIDRSL